MRTKILCFVSMLITGCQSFSGSVTLRNATTALQTDSTTLPSLPSANSPAPSKSSPSPIPAPSVMAVLSGYMGYASEQGSVTGGAGGKTVTVSTYADLKSAVAGSTPLIVKVSGSINGNDTQINVGSNKSIIGLPGAELHGLGLYMFGVSNIIIQNLKMWAGDPSAIDAAGFSAWSVKQGSHHVWVDHCEMYASPKDSASLSHSLASVTDSGDYVTVSWSEFHDQYLGFLIGSDATTNQGYLHVTIHHSLFENVGERQPKALWGRVHLFNNYYKDAKNDGHTPVGVTSTDGAIVRMDANYFSNFRGIPIATRYDVLADGYVGGLETNYQDGIGTNNITTLPSAWLPPYDYSKYLTPVMDVPSVVTNGAGANLK